MSNAFADIAFTSAVKAAQQLDGSRAAYARNFERGDEVLNQRLGADEADFIAQQRSFYMATVSETGWPYVQHRGGPRGFLQVLNDETLAPQGIVDLDLSYDVTDHVRVSIGANNLLNEYPDITKVANRGTPQFAYYNQYSPYGISGGFYYAKMAVTF